MPGHARVEPAAKRINATILLEVALATALLFGTRPLFALVTAKFAGPLSLLTTLAILTVYLRTKGIGWRDLGLVRLTGWKPKALVVPKAIATFALFCMAVALVLFVGEPLGLSRPDGLPQGAQDRWGDVEGNLPMLLLWLGVVWTSAAFGEEIFFRGYLITRIETALGPVRGRVVMAVLLSAVLFGYAHYYYQGLYGFVMTGLIGLAFGIAFVLFRRNLWPIAIVHGIIDTINFVSIYLGDR